MQVLYICTTEYFKNMATIKAFIRTTKKDGFANVRFRLADGRNVQLFHKSDILVLPLLWDKKKEQYKSKVIIPEGCKTREELYRGITDRKNLILQLYSKHKIGTSEQLTELIDKEVNPELYLDDREKTIDVRFSEYIDRCYEEGIFGESRLKHYRVLLRELTRFLIINDLTSMKPIDFTSEILTLFRNFLLTEHNLVDKYRGLYVGVKNPPVLPRSQNTVATKLSQLHAFFTELESNDDVPVSPFRKLGKKRKSVMMKEQYDEPYFLTKAEFLRMKDKEVPEQLRETKDVFLLQCALGCRIGDFKRLSGDNIAIEDNIPYVHYLPEKSKKEGDLRVEIRTPLMLFALDVVKKYDFKFPILKYVSGKSGYNAKIKSFLEHCEIVRLVAVFNGEANEYKRICDVASSKLARKTHVDIMNKVQIDKYAAGLHKKGSSAVNHYTSLSLKDRFNLMCAAFECETYKVDNELNLL